MRKNPQLPRLILQDFIYVGWFPLLLLTFVLVTSIAIVCVTHLTREKIIQQDFLLSEREQLQIESRNQVLESFMLSEHSRIEMKATNELDMVRPDSEHEIIVSQ